VTQGGRPALVRTEVLAPIGVGTLAVILAVVSLVCAGLLLAAWRTFFRLSGDFAEEL
jgi:hypothetical protein